MDSLGIDFTQESIQQLILTLVILLAGFVLSRLGRRLVGRYIEDPARKYRTAKLVSRVVAVLVLGVVIALWSPELGDLSTFLTVIGAGLAIALREVLLGFAGWMFILFRRLFEQGDRIEINGMRGDVVDIRLQYATLMEVGGWVDADQSTGRIVHVPTSYVLLHPVYNYTHGFNFIWNELPVTVTFQSDWHAARDIMLGLARESSDIVEKQAADELRRLSREYLIYYSQLSPFVYVRIVDNGVRLTLRFLCEVRKRRGLEHAISLRLLEEFKTHGGIDLAYPMLGVRTENRPGDLFGPP